MRKMATSETADCDACPARLFVLVGAIVTFKLQMLVLTSGDSDVTTSSNDLIVLSLYDGTATTQDDFKCIMILALLIS